MCGVVVLKVSEFQQEFINYTDPSEVIPLLQEDWDEIDHPAKRGCDLNPDWDTYRLLEERGLYKVFTARVGGTLVGYFGVFIAPSMHSKGHIMPMADAFYLKKEYRNSRIGIRLFKFVEKCMKEDGHKSLCVISTESYPLDKLLNRLKYTKVETRFEKVL